TRHVSVVSVVTSPGNVALAIRNVLHDRRQRRTFSLLRQPDSRRQLGAVTHWNEDVLYFTDLIGKRFDNAHGTSLHSFDRFNLERESLQAGPVTLLNLVVIITRNIERTQAIAEAILVHQVTQTHARLHVDTHLSAGKTLAQRLHFLLARHPFDDAVPMLVRDVT